MWPNQQQQFDILDIINVLSFILQIQNSASYKIDALKDEMEQKLDEDIKIQLDRIERKLDMLLIDKQMM